MAKRQITLLVDYEDGEFPERGEFTYNCIEGKLRSAEFVILPDFAEAPAMRAPTVPHGDACACDECIPKVTTSNAPCLT